MCTEPLVQAKCTPTKSAKCTHSACVLHLCNTVRQVLNIPTMQHCICVLNSKSLAMYMNLVKQQHLGAAVHIYVYLVMDFSLFTRLQRHYNSVTIEIRQTHACINPTCPFSGLIPNEESSLPPTINEFSWKRTDESSRLSALSGSGSIISPSNWYNLPSRPGIRRVSTPLSFNCEKLHSHNTPYDNSRKHVNISHSGF